MSGGGGEAERETFALPRRPDAKLDEVLALLTRLPAPPHRTEPGG